MALMNSLLIAQAKSALKSHLAIVQRRLAKAMAERDRAMAQIQSAEDRAEIAERAARDVARDRDQWRERALRAEAAMASMGSLPHPEVKL
jgi:hypothetical protein